MALAVVALALDRPGRDLRFSARHLSGTLLGIGRFVLAVVAFSDLGDLAQNQARSVPRDVTFLAPVQQAGSALTVEVANLEDKPSVLELRRLCLARAARAGGVGLSAGSPSRRASKTGLRRCWAGPCSPGRPCAVRTARRFSLS